MKKIIAVLMLSALAACGQVESRKVADFSGGDSFVKDVKTSIADGLYALLPYGPNVKERTFVNDKEDGSMNACYQQKYKLQVVAFDYEGKMLPVSSGEEYFSWPGAVGVEAGRVSEIFPMEGLAKWPSLLLKVPAAKVELVAFRVAHSSYDCGDFEFIGYLSAKQLSSPEEISAFIYWEYGWSNLAYLHGLVREAKAVIVQRRHENEALGEQMLFKKAAQAMRMAAK